MGEIDYSLAMIPKKSEYIVKKCTAVHYYNTGNKTYDIAPKTNSEILFYSGRYYTCEFRIRMFNNSYSGRWEITTYYVKSFNIDEKIKKKREYVDVFSQEVIK